MIKQFGSAAARTCVIIESDQKKVDYRFWTDQVQSSYILINYEIFSSLAQGMVVAPPMRTRKDLVIYITTSMHMIIGQQHCMNYHLIY